MSRAAPGLLQVRRLDPADWPAYRALMLQAVNEHADRFRLTEADVQSEPPPLGASADGFTLGAFHGGGLVGVVSVARESRFKLRHKALLYRMYVSAEQAGLGIGRTLLERAITAARELADVRHINLTVLSGNLRARALYESFGFKTFSTEPAAVFAAGEYREEQTMKLLLDSSTA